MTALGRHSEFRIVTRVHSCLLVSTRTQARRPYKTHQPAPKESDHALVHPKPAMSTATADHHSIHQLRSVNLPSFEGFIGFLFYPLDAHNGPRGVLYLALNHRYWSNSNTLLFLLIAWYVVVIELYKPHPVWDTFQATVGVKVIRWIIVVMVAIAFGFFCACVGFEVK
ncbi:uncharacterized protein EDB91DRAFT_40965 [Suillus paluster]|uniref:uncharacterized protein n=1 Tax=Suillus paluster TaxID=48578 RepID=UPI001B883EDA|nr:uncharacterized protein EDB91DRAFT_40965 [Suillus paluster]KAG1756887.1 hypothetical protein EDB91DRAFT_40965 [Suillus paluster]